MISVSSDPIPDTIYRQIEKLKKSIDAESDDISKKEWLVCDMVDYLTDNKPLDLKKLPYTTFTPALSLEIPCFTFPSTETIIACPLEWQEQFIRTNGAETYVSLQLKNSTKKFFHDIVCTLYEENGQNFLDRTRFCSVEFAREHDEPPCIAEDDNIRLSSLYPFSARCVGPGRVIFLTVAFETPVTKERLSFLINCKVSTCAESPTPTQHFSRPIQKRAENVEAGQCYNWQGTLCDLYIDPWSPDSSKFLPQSPSSSNFQLVLSSLVAFSFSCTAKISITRDFISDKLFEFKPLTEGVYISNSVVLSSLVVFCHQKMSNDFYYSFFASAENIIDRFFKKLIQLKYCMRIQVCDVDRFSNDSTNEIKTRMVDRQISMLNELETHFEEENGKISLAGDLLRKLKIDLTISDLQYTQE